MLERNLRQPRLLGNEYACLRCTPQGGSNLKAAEKRWLLIYDNAGKFFLNPSAPRGSIQSEDV